MEPEEPRVPGAGHPEVEEYGDEGIASGDAPIPGWLKCNYVLWIVVGFVGFYLFWNGSAGWLDRGYWNELQRAASTVYPFNTVQLIEDAKK
ncbi:MAG: hypothetical protein WCF65_03810 [Parachlamydiaceae bacterium]